MRAVTGLFRTQCSRTWREVKASAQRACQPTETTECSACPQLEIMRRNSGSHFHSQGHLETETRPGDLVPGGRTLAKSRPLHLRRPSPAQRYPLAFGAAKLDHSEHRRLRLWRLATGPHIHTLLPQSPRG